MCCKPARPRASTQDRSGWLPSSEIRHLSSALHQAGCLFLKGLNGAFHLTGLCFLFRVCDSCLKSKAMTNGLDVAQQVLHGGLIVSNEFDIATLVQHQSKPHHMLSLASKISAFTFNGYGEQRASFRAHAHQSCAVVRSALLFPPER